MRQLSWRRSAGWKAEKVNRSTDAPGEGKALRRGCLPLRRTDFGGKECGGRDG